MSFSPSLSLVRLQELKLWQGSYENSIRKSKANSQTTDYEHLEGVSVLEHLNASAFSLDRGRRNSKDWDKKKISPSKPFEQLLEEKLAEDPPMKTNTKPKKPFLRKGQGLARFRMGPTVPITNKSKYHTPKRPSGRRKAPTTPMPQPGATPIARKGILKHSNTLYHQYVDLSPLTLPDFVKPRGTWKNVFENCEKIETGFSQDDKKSAKDTQDDVEDYEEFRLSLGFGEQLPINLEEIDSNDGIRREGEEVFAKSSSQQVLEGQDGDADIRNDQHRLSSLANYNQTILEKISDYAHRYFRPAKAYVSNNIPKKIPEMSTPKFKDGAGDLTLYEERMERELKAFEELEKKIENSSFCSTDTSVANLLASTPQKATLSNENFKDSEIPGDIEFTNDRKESIQMKLLEVAEKTDVLQHFLMNLRKMDDKAVQQGDFTLHRDETKKSETSTSTNTSFSEDNSRWSTGSHSLTDNYTDYDTTCQSDNCKKIDVGVNTSFDASALDETVKKCEPCKDCEELRSKLSDIKIKFSDKKFENSTYKTEVRELDKKIEQLKKDMKKNNESYQARLETLQEELDQERKKLAKEKSYFESYVKDSQNRATKKEREEITQLKQELADAKELLKLKDTKNGASQARLRTQIKQQEKELSELKITVEKLQRENAKLNASQKFMRRPQEAKMLHEINKNLSKLTEEAFKKQMNKSGTSDSEENVAKVTSKEKRKSVNYDEGVVNTDSEKYGKNASNKEVQNGLASKESCKMDSAGLDLTSSDALSIEKRYEHVFGGFQSPRNCNVSTDLEKTETMLTDGSIEIAYSNGNVKTISSDRQVIVIKYFNGDTKETNLKEQIIRYHYAATDSRHTQYADGTEVVEYKDGQKSKKYVDGKTEVSYNDGSFRIINTDGTEEHQFPDGRKILKNLQDEQIILLPNGQREVHTKDYKRREYPDGTIRTLRKDGAIETVYSNGRVRLKDSNGVLIMDTLQSP